MILLKRCLKDCEISQRTFSRDVGYSLGALNHALNKGVFPKKVVRFRASVEAAIEGSVLMMDWLAARDLGVRNIWQNPGAVNNDRGKEGKMNLTELGYDLVTGRHDRRLTKAEERFIGILWVNHVGEDNAISADLLAIRYHLGTDHSVDFRTVDLWKRIIRNMHNHLLFEHDNIPIMSRAGIGGGYWMAESEEEGAAFYRRFHKRAMTGLRKATRGKKAAVIEMVHQMTFELEEFEDKTPNMRPRATIASTTPIEVVDSLIGRMMQNPERYAEGLLKIREKYGSVLMPKAHVAALKAKAAELSAMMAGL
ncbi:hypothetical protein PITCH_A1970012 [uncultured Desulfobacterium sp.]|uniref:Uncharacterized protein n=1 Tax=uncultured Desulfobacterium sp. TaxID=201089 RepID=A0A445MWH9_9BACT|nr:hypothetical protein PITCH_A1970012 [uncultured Desulfobacterium sp.]